MRSALLILLATTTAFGGEMLLEDDFEGGGFSEAWAKVHPGVELIPEDPAQPDGNHVARLDAQGEGFCSPPACPGDRDTAVANEDAYYDRWDNYEYSFRFRIHPITDRPEVGGNTAAFLTVSWRAWPAEESPYERQLLFIQAWRPALTWRIAGPMTQWFGRNTGIEDRNVLALHKELLATKVDDQWHTLTVRCLYDRVQLWWDGQLYFDGRDDRVLAGSIGLTYHWSDHQVQPAPIDIDDVVVRRIDALPNDEVPE